MKHQAKPHKYRGEEDPFDEYDWLKQMEDDRSAMRVVGVVLCAAIIVLVGVLMLLWWWL